MGSTVKQLVMFAAIAVAAATLTRRAFRLQAFVITVKHRPPMTKSETITFSDGQ